MRVKGDRGSVDGVAWKAWVMTGAPGVSAISRHSEDCVLLPRVWTLPTPAMYCRTCNCNSRHHKQKHNNLAFHDDLFE